MGSGIINGFQSIIDFFTAVWTLISNIFSAITSLFARLADIINTANSYISYFPVWLVAPALFCLSVKLLTNFIHMKAGD